MDISETPPVIHTSPTVVASVPVTLINVIWPMAVPHLERVVEVANGELTLESIKSKLLLGQALLFLACVDEDIVAVATAEVRIFDSGKKSLVLPIVGGDNLDDWMVQLLEIAKLLAKDLGCTELRGLGARKGWTRILKPYGWEEAYTVIRCEV